MTAKAQPSSKAVAHRTVQMQRRVDRMLWGAILGVGTMLTWLSIARYQGYNAGMLDLGNMAQAIASVQWGQPLVYTAASGPTSRLAFHVEWFYFLLAVPYMLWPDPRLLLIIQAVLFVLGALPVYWMTLRHTHSVVAARCLALIYLLYPTAQTSVLFDLHGDTLAMPLLLFALDALDRRAWRSYGLFTILALSCKFYVALPVAVLGLLIWWLYGERGIGWITSISAMVYGAVAFLVIRPLFTTAATSDVHRGLNYITFYFGRLQEIAATWDQRLINALIVFAPVLLVSWRGWYWLLPGMPVAAAVLLSTGPGGAYDFRYHHYAIVVPFILMAAIAGVTRMSERSSAAPVQRKKGRSWQGDLGLNLGIVIIFNIAFVDTPLNPLFWMKVPGYGLDSSGYGRTDRDRMKDRFLREVVPPDAAIATSVFLAPHLVNRETLYVVRYPDDPGGWRFPAILPQVDYVLADALFDYRRVTDNRVAGGITYEIREIVQVLDDPDFALVTMRDGLLLFQRNAPPAAALLQQVDVLDAHKPALSTDVAGPIALVGTEIEPLGRRRWRATFEWQRTRSEPLNERYVAVSWLDGIDHTRMVHLPTYVLFPTMEWASDHIIRETFDVQIPPDIDPGRYTWKVAWYHSGHSEAYATDERSQVADSPPLIVGTIEVEKE